VKVYEIRDPIFGFITINDWEREIIDHRAFQRLRRIRQLAWTDMVYPGATHTRFEHSLGVMKIATEMFNSMVYFQHSRRAYDCHVANAMKHLLNEVQSCACSHRGKFPPPIAKENIEDYLEWDDWLVLGLLQTGGGGEHGKILRERKHHRAVFETTETPAVEELTRLEEVCNELGEMVSFIDQAEKSWYKFGKEFIQEIKSIKPHFSEAEIECALTELENKGFI